MSGRLARIFRLRSSNLDGVGGYTPHPTLDGCFPRSYGPPFPALVRPGPDDTGVSSGGGWRVRKEPL
jgi:hypothetical protein